MGQELPASVDFIGPLGRATSEGKALLETTELVFRGGFSLRVPFRDISSLRAEGGRLSVEWPGGQADFELGARYAAAWADKIKNPKGLLDKLGVRRGARVSVLGIGDESWLQQLKARTGDVAFEAAQPDSDIVFYAADDAADLARLDELRQAIKDDGAIWVVSLKGKSARVRDVDVIAAAKAAGLVDAKVVSFSATHTALKLVVPLSMRAGARRPPKAGSGVPPAGR